MSQNSYLLHAIGQKGTKKDREPTICERNYERYYKQ